MRAIPVGFMLHPDLDFHRRAVPLVRAHADYIGIAPETGWKHAPDGTLVDNGYARLYDEVAASFQLPVVAHGVGLSPATAAPDDHARVDAWRAKTASERSYDWWTDHHGLALGGEWISLPMPPLPTPDAVEHTAARLDAMRAVSPEVGLETTAFYAHWGDPCRDAALQTAIAREADSHILLDLHNVWTMARNGGFSAEAWLAHLDLTRVIEIHLSGGSPADPAWGGGLRPMWLDGHDGAVPEPVWRLFEAVLPYCPNLRGVLLERMEGTLLDAEVPEVDRELRRLRALCAAVPRHTPSEPEPMPLLPAIGDEAWLRWERSLGPALRTRSGLATTSEHLPEPHRIALSAADADGVKLSAMLMAKLRYERVLHGVSGATEAADADPAGFARRFFAYHRATPATAFFPWQEAALWEAASP
ncbi:MAG: DUF692 family protein [Deltaproteobacteria bacterium]|nr:MAG: DUF692 family protein [Deltaproteobacteria bacterium]